MKPEYKVWNAGGHSEVRLGDRVVLKTRDHDECPKVAGELNNRVNETAAWADENEELKAKLAESDKLRAMAVKEADQTQDELFATQAKLADCFAEYRKHEAAEITALREDKARLDWLQKHGASIECVGPDEAEDSSVPAGWRVDGYLFDGDEPTDWKNFVYGADEARDAIDAARKAAK